MIMLWVEATSLLRKENMLGNPISPFPPHNNLVAHRHFHGSSTSSSSGEEEGDKGCKKFILIIFVTGFVTDVILGVIYGIHKSNGSVAGASNALEALIVVGGVTMVAPIVLGVITTLIKKTSPSSSRVRSSRQLTAGVKDQLGSETNQTIERFFAGIARERPIRFTRQDLHTFTHNFSEKLGAGGFGIVYKGEFSGANIAVKVLQRNVEERIKEQFMAEVGTIGRTNHINLVKLYGFCFDQSMKALVYEYLENGSLDRFLFSGKNGYLDWEKLLDIAIGTAKGIAYLHEECQQRIIHYDIKPGNVLLDTDWTPKVADFGLAKLCNRDSTHVTMSGARGTPGYAAPELWFPIPVTEKCDVYSYGMLLFEIVGRRKNLNINMSSESQEWFPRWVWENHEQQNWEAILHKCGVEEQHMHKVREVLLVALWCVQYSPESRPRMRGVVKMLEGGMEVPLPPNPFNHQSAAATGITRESKSSSTGSANTTTTLTDENENEATPIMRKYEIEMARQSP